MRILITNDDGINAQGLQTLCEVLSSRHDVFVVAPESERSGYSHSITLRDPVIFQETAPRRYACSGTPADCVDYALHGAISLPCDLVLSGINHGPNLGTDILYSGTVAAARQAAIMGVPSMALSSLKGESGHDFAAAADFLLQNLEVLMVYADRVRFLNINFPSTQTGFVGSRLTSPGVRKYQTRLKVLERNQNVVRYKLDGSSIFSENTEGSDWEAVSQKYISISPLANEPASWGVPVDPSCFDGLEKLA